MNERIKLLAEQAGIAVWGDAVYMYHPTDTLDSAVLEKFAELIIQEAIGVCRVDVDALTAPFLPEYEKGIVEGYRRANENLRVYFGVEL